MENISEKSHGLTHLLLDEKSGGDSFEKCLWPFVKDQFSNYEAFWSEFVWPLTNRVYSDRANRKNLHFRPELESRCEDLMWLAQAHYTAFRKLGSIYLRVHKWTFETPANEDSDAILKLLLHHDRFLDVYTLFLSVDDMLSAIASTIRRLHEKVGLVTATVEPTPEELRKEFEAWLQSDAYKDAIENYRLTGFPVSIPVLHRGRCLQEMLPVDLRKEYNGFRDRTARYRNLLHNPQPTQAWIGGEHRVPKPEKLKKYWLWSKITTASEKDIEDDFEFVEKALEQDWHALIDLTNRIWRVFLENMKKIAETAQYKEWLAPLPKESDNYATLTGASYATWALGVTSSAAFFPASLSAVRMDDKKPKKT